MLLSRIPRTKLSTSYFLPSTTTTPTTTTAIRRTRTTHTARTPTPPAFSSLRSLSVRATSSNSFSFLAHSRARCRTASYLSTEDRGLCITKLSVNEFASSPSSSISGIVELQGHLPRLPPLKARRESPGTNHRSAGCSVTASRTPRLSNQASLHSPSKVRKHACRRRLAARNARLPLSDTPHSHYPN